MSIPHLPLLRAGRPYRSLDTSTLSDVRSGAPVAEVSQANPGLISRDLTRLAQHQRVLQEVPVSELLALCRRAAARYRDADLPLGDDTQSADDYLRQLAATTGLPIALAAFNRDKIVHVLEEMEQVLGGLTRGLDPAILDRGHGQMGDRRLAYQRQSDGLGAVLPSNSPGVHGLWLPAIPLKVPLVLRAGSREPWTPWRVAMAFLDAGCPPEAFSLYPSGHDGATQIMLRTGRSLLFGDGDTVAPWRGDPRVQIHGPGQSKVVLGPGVDVNDDAVVDLVVDSVASNGGRSCLNASGAWTVAGGRELAEGVAERLAAIPALPLDDPDARLASFSDPRVAEAIDIWLTTQLNHGGAEELTAKYRQGPRMVEVDGCRFLLPTLVWCDSPDHTLAQAELLFPFAAVVESPRDEILSAIGPTLVGTALGDEPAWVDDVLACRHIDRLNLGMIPTQRISWDQPHEGNLFAHLYEQRALQAIA